MDKYAVMGHPITHSKSPQIHTLFAQQTHQALEYTRIDVPPDDFVSALNGFFNHSGKGLNITVPLKQLAWENMHELDVSAKNAQAVNTVVLQADGKLKGYNTDGIGLVRDLTSNHQVTITNKSLLVIGAGGAVQGILEALLQQKPAQLTICNRTIEKAHSLAKKFSSSGNISACGLDEFSNNTFDIIINGTSSSLYNEVPAIPDSILNPGGISYDLMYSDQATPFVEWGKGNGASKSLDGLGMLVEQAAEAFYIWRNVRPDTKPLIEALRP